jgi:ribonuclease P protein subunit POP4
MKKKEILFQDFIGKNITITKSQCISQEKIHGKIINETKNTFVIETKQGNKKIIKKQIKFIINNQNEEICGENIIKKPDERLKMRIQND